MKRPKLLLAVLLISLLTAWYQQLPDLSDKPRQKYSRRPDRVQLSSVPSTFQKVIGSGDASQDEVGWDVTRRSQR